MNGILLAFLFGMILASRPREARPPSPPSGIGTMVAIEITVLVFAIGLFWMIASVGR